MRYTGRFHDPDIGTILVAQVLFGDNHRREAFAGIREVGDPKAKSRVARQPVQHTRRAKGPQVRGTDRGRIEMTSNLCPRVTGDITVAS